MVDIEILKQKIVKSLRSLNPEKIILFGSYAYGDPTEGNPEPVYDFDVLIQNVTMVGYFYGNMADGMGSSIDLTNVGMDNFRIEFDQAPVSTEALSFDNVKALYR